MFVCANNNAEGIKKTVGRAPTVERGEKMGGLTSSWRSKLATNVFGRQVSNSTSDQNGYDNGNYGQAIDNHDSSPLICRHCGVHRYLEHLKICASRIETTTKST